MTTTAIVAEILIVGLETAAWILVLILALSGPREARLADLKGWEALLTVLVLGAAYVLGVVVDRLADDLRYQLDRVWPGRPVDKPAGITRMRLVIMQQGGDLSAFLIYQRSRLRVARATAFNLIISIPVVLLFLRSWPGLGWPMTAVPVVLLGLAIGTFIAYRHLEFAYISWLADAHRLLTDSRDGVDIAAAVPYCLKKGKLLVLLVRTKGGGPFWTFPKGHRKKDEDETLPEAAKREAMEEAGIRGRIDSERLIEFVYPNKSDPKNPDRVAAYLLKVRHCQEPKGEPGREPSWLSPEEAVVKLAEGGREPEYAEGLKAVVQRAERKIAPEHD